MEIPIGNSILILMYFKLYNLQLLLKYGIISIGKKFYTSH